MLFLDYFAFFIVIWLLMGTLTPAGGNFRHGHHPGHLGLLAPAPAQDGDRLRASGQDVPGMNILANVTAKLNKADLKAVLERALAAEHPDYRIVRIDYRTEAVYSGHGMNESMSQEFAGVDILMEKKQKTPRELMEEFTRKPTPRRSPLCEGVTMTGLTMKAAWEATRDWVVGVFILVGDLLADICLEDI